MGGGGNSVRLMIKRCLFLAFQNYFDYVCEENILPNVFQTSQAQFALYICYWKPGLFNTVVQCFVLGPESIPRLERKWGSLK